MLAKKLIIEAVDNHDQFISIHNFNNGWSPGIITNNTRVNDGWWWLLMVFNDKS